MVAAVKGAVAQAGARVAAARAVVAMAAEKVGEATAVAERAAGVAAAETAVVEMEAVAKGVAVLAVAMGAVVWAVDLEGVDSVETVGEGQLGAAAMAAAVHHRRANCRNRTVAMAKAAAGWRRPG
jgi:hypothetical protein